eukprot:TRINITY_DN44696_c0_g1_i1.p1 TRINITY_DN44696_c0_g1~~TRINITY_DN44696_c0_g1_i1.p1  ORF type:complete len:445 (+),score=73.70 TRINITY_DN44696_c0_g1_i1:89-1336(+)
MAERFTHTITVEDVDANSASLLHDMFQTMQTTIARVYAERNKLSAERNRLEAKVQELTRTNETLLSENQRQRMILKDFDGQTNGSAVGKGGAAATPPLFTLEKAVELHSAPVHSVTMVQNDEIMATASWDASVKLYNIAQQKVVRTLGDGPQAATMGGLYAVATAKQHPELLGCPSSDHSIYIWEHTTGTLKKRFPGHTSEVNGIDFHSSQNIMCSASDDKKLIIWDYHAGLMLRTMTDHQDAVYGATFMAGKENEFLVASCSFDRKIRIFDMRTKKVVSELRGHTDDVIGLDYCASRGTLASSSDDGLVILWDFKKQEALQKLQTRVDLDSSENEVKRVKFSPDGAYLAAACSNGCVAVYDLDNKCTLRETLGGHAQCVFEVAWGVCPKSQRKVLVTASHDHTSRIWREGPVGA